MKNTDRRTSYSEYLRIEKLDPAILPLIDQRGYQIVIAPGLVVFESSEEERYTFTMSGGGRFERSCSIFGTVATKFLAKVAIREEDEAQAARS